MVRRFTPKKIKLLPKRSWIEDFLYLTIFNYLKFNHDHFYYNKIHLLNKENILPVGTPLIIASNHQNAINDPLAIEFAFHDRVVTIFTRADAFKKNLIGKFLRTLYLLPAYRMRTDGEDTLKYNYAMFEEAGGRLLGGNAVAIFPEATNQDKHWLGDFSLAYLRMAFETAKDSDFETDIHVLPIAIHYADYFKMQEDMMITCGTPISLKPYYELYKSKPRTAQREVNREVRRQIEAMMLNITDLDNYEAIDYIRNTYGVPFAERNQLNPSDLPQKLKADQMLVEILNNLKDNDKEMAEQIFSDALLLKKEVGQSNFSESLLFYKGSNFMIFMMCISFILLFPIFVIGLIPNAIVYYSVEPIVNKFKNIGGKLSLLASGVRFVMMSLYAMPLFYALTVALECIFLSWIVGVVHLVLMPFLGIFAVHYVKGLKSLHRILKYKWVKRTNYSKVQKIINIRDRLFKNLDKIAWEQ